MNPLLLAFVVGAAELPFPHDTSRLDANVVCSHLRDEFGELLLAHQNQFPSGTQIDIELKAEAETGTISVTLLVEAPHAQRTREVYSVNTCQEAMNLLDFQLGVGYQPPPLRPPPAPATETKDDERTGPEPASNVSPSGLGGGVFSAGSTNYPGGFGVGVGGGVHVAFERLRLDGYGVWMQPLHIVSPSVNKADYSFSRVDWGVLSRVNVLSEPFGLAPCLGVGVMSLEVAEDQVAPQANRSAHSWAVDAGVSISKSVFSLTTLEGTLLLRYAWQTVDLNDLRVGDFAPGALEVNMRVGFSFDIWARGETSASVTKASSHGGASTWQ